MSGKHVGARPRRGVPASVLATVFLLAAQLAILAVMLAVTWRARRAFALAAGSETFGLPRARRLVLGVLGSIYMSGALARLAIGVLAPGAPAWFRAFIPGVFHVVLAAFVLAWAANPSRLRPSAPGRSPAQARA